MTNAKKILITTESHEVFILRRRVRTFPQHTCPICSTLTCGLTLDDARAYAGLSALELIRSIEAAAIYAYEIEGGGPLLICQKSLDLFCNGEK
jgi:hypothetical protein